jgi:hypothetical protein
MPPKGDGYMPFYCAANWIATKGASFNFDPEELPVWKTVYRELLDAIASEKIRVVGNRDNAQEEVAGHHFVGCAIQYPHHTIDFDLAIGNDLWLLQSYPYEDEDDWRDGFSDALVDRQGKGWSRLMILKSDVLRVWPFAPWKPTATGAPGRATMMAAVEREFRLRASKGNFETSAIKQGAALAAWFAKAHPDEQRLKAKSIENKIRAEYRKLAPLKLPKNG